MISHVMPDGEERPIAFAENNCIMWGMPVVIPEKFRVKLLHNLHKDHSGTCKMKSIIRSHFWWPGINKEIEEKVKGCRDCLAVKKSPSVAPLHPWEWPS